MPNPENKPSSRTDLASLTPMSDPDPVHSTPIDHDAIARRAYEIYLSRGEAHGFDQHDWHQAEQELREVQDVQA